MPLAYLTVAEVASLLRLSRKTVKRYTHQHRLPHIRLSNNVIRYDPESLRTYLAQLEQPSRNAET